MNAAKGPAAIIICRICHRVRDEADVRVRLGIPRCPYCDSVQILEHPRRETDGGPIEFPAPFRFGRRTIG